MAAGPKVDYDVNSNDELSSNDSSGEEPQARRMFHRLASVGLVLGVATVVCVATLGGRRAFQQGSFRASVKTPGGSLGAQSEVSVFDNQGLAPVEDRHDGNLCEDDEELLNGLCYKTCKELTDGAYPIRTSPFSCCDSHPCLLNQKFRPQLCSGFDISGDQAGGGCPHKPGACYEDEELSLGMCYKKCSLLTDNEFPYRLAAATCCKVRGAGCLNLLHTKTSKAYDRAGGPHEGGEPHFPLQALTEAPN